MNRSCPRCHAETPPDDNFCEDCGAVLAETADAACPKCSAGAEAIDEEGFCSDCGHRRAERGRDHLEIDLSPDFAGVTDRGRRHHRNEDYLALKTIDEPAASVLIVCDGVSSVRDPDLAAATAAERALLDIEESFRSGEPFDETRMQSAFAAAQASVESIPCGTAQDGERPATTMVAAVVQNEQVLIGWLGDSRAYWIDEEGARALTSDHSWMNDVVSSGELSTADARRSPFAHAITRWVGSAAEASFVPSLVHLEIAGPGTLLLCTDGLWNYDPELPSFAGPAALSTARALVEFARANGGNDNITAAVWTKRDVPPPTP